MTPGFEWYVRAAGNDVELFWHASGNETSVKVDAAGKTTRTTQPSLIVPTTLPVTRVVDDDDETKDDDENGTRVRVCPVTGPCKFFKPAVKSQQVVYGASSDDGSLVAVTAATDINDRGTLLLYDGTTGALLDQVALKGGDDTHPGGTWFHLFADHTIIETFSPAATDASYVKLYVVKGGKLREAGSSKRDALGTYHANKKLLVWSKSDADLHVEVFDVDSGKLAFETDVKGFLAGASESDSPLSIHADVVGESVVATVSFVSPARLAYIPMKRAGAAKVVELPTCPAGTL